MMDDMASMLALPDIHVPRKPRILVASTGLIEDRIVDSLLPQIGQIPDCSVKAIIDENFHKRYFAATNTLSNASTKDAWVESCASELCQWADMLVLAPIDANNLAKMLHGHTDNLLLKIIRSWNVSNKIIMVPGMSVSEWENPMTKKQLTKIRRKWNFVQVLQPVLWTFQRGSKTVSSWKGLGEALEMLRNQIDLMNIGQGVICSPVQKSVPFHRRTASAHSTSKSKLPPELWTMIIDFTNDWELAQRLAIYTNLKTPPEWTRHMSAKGPDTFTEKLEWLLLTTSSATVKSYLTANPDKVPRCLSRLSTRMIMRFAPVSLLSYFESELPELFWATFGNTFLPDKASSVFGRVEILEWWHTSPSCLNKKYTAEAIDGASRQGFVNVLEWWRSSGLPLHYTEAAMEQASGQGHVDVLAWWRRLIGTAAVDKPVAIKPGKSICYATQAGHADVVRWWLASGIPFQGEALVPKLASTYGHVAVLQAWHEAKGSKMVFDNQVLVGATKLGHVAVLEWWKRSELRVEYKTCDVEEALEDGVGGRKGDEVRRWWARNGLNLGVGTSEWMRSKVL